MIWNRTLMVLSVLCLGSGFERHLRKIPEKESSSWYPSGTKKTLDTTRELNKSPKIVADSSAFVLKSQLLQSQLQSRFPRSAVTPEQPIEDDSDNDNDIENVSDYDERDTLYNSKGYLQDQPESDSDIIPSGIRTDNSGRSIDDGGGGTEGSQSKLTERDSIEKSNGNPQHGSSGGGGGESVGESETFKPNPIPNFPNPTLRSSTSTTWENEEDDEGGRGKLTGDSHSKSHENNNGQKEIPLGRDQEEKLLLQKLMEGYEKDVRPVRNSSQPVVIRVGITLTQIFDMDEKQQVMTTNVWLDQEWNDEMLRWDPQNYSGLETIRLPCDRIWLPDIVLYNNADDYTRGYMPSRAMVSYDGNVFWPPPTKFRSTCSVDVTYFPFDDQVCFLKLGSWTYNGFQVDVTNRTSEVDLSNYISNGEWELVKAVQKRNVVYYSCCPEPFPDVTVTLVIRRKTLYYIYNIVLPCIMLSALTLLVFCLPPDSGEKIALGITVLLAFSVFMLAINESLPETSESIPLIGVYLTIVMAITSVSVIMTVVVLNLHYLGPQVKPVPSWLMCLLPRGNGSQSRIRQKSLLIPVTHREPKSGSLKRGHIFITQWRRGAGGGGEGYSIDVPGTSEKLEDMVKDTSDVPAAESITNENTGNYSNNTRIRHPRTSSISSTGPIHCESTSASCFNRQQPHQQNQQRHSSQSSLNREAGERGGDNCNNGNGTIFEELLTSIRHLINKQEEVEAQNNLVAEWRLVAQVVDRILFWIFFTFTMSSSTLILLILPIYKRSWYGSPLAVINDTDTNPIES